MELKETVQAVPNEVEADALSDTVIFSRIETNRINERVKHTWFKKPGNIVLLDYSTESDGQITQTTRTLFPTASVMPIPIGNQKYTIHDLGNGWSIQEVAIEGTWTGSPPVFTQKVFAGNRYETRRNDPVPVEFQGQTPVESQEFTEVGRAAQPILGTDDLLKWEQDVDTYLRRVHNEGRDSILLPVVLHAEDTNNLGQTVTITKKYKVAPPPDGTGSATTDPSATVQVVVEALGGDPLINGMRVIETVRSVANVPPQSKWTVQVEDSIPLSFRATFPTTAIETTDTPIATGAPTLGPNELLHEVENLDVFKKRTRIVSRPTVTGSQTEREWRGPKDGEGSEFTSVVSKAGSLVAPSTVPPTGQSILDSKVTPVSPTQSLEEVSTAGTFPVLTETTQDKRTRFKITRTKSIVDNAFVPVADSTGANYYSTKALDSERSELIREFVQVGVDGSGIADVYQQFDGLIDVQLPVQLLKVTGIANTLVGEADYFMKSNAYALGGKGSASVHGNASVKAVAGVTTDVSYTAREPWGRDVPCTHYLFPVFRTNANLRAGQQIAIFNANMGPLGAPNLLAWPKFAPEAVNIICVSQRISAVGQADGAYSEVTALDYLGVSHGASVQAVSGAGGDVEIEMATKIVRLPPSIHGSIVIKQPTGTPANGVGTLLKPQAHATGQFALGTNVFTITADIPAPDKVNGVVQGSIQFDDQGVSAGTITTTKGATQIPTIGTYLYKFFAEPYDYDYMLLHYIVVDFADIL